MGDNRAGERGWVAAAYAVHLFTATGAVLAILALGATIEKRFDLAFLWLGLALFVDGIDGTFARITRVTERAARYDGAVLDLVIDYTTYVFVPAAILLVGGYLPGSVAWAVLGVMTLTAALYFSDTEMKTEEGGFQGFPACWNVVVFYICVFEVGPWWCVGLILVLSALQFAPIPFLHPMRVKRLRVPTLIVTAAWTIACFGALWHWGREPFWVEATLLVGAVWVLVVGAWRGRA